MKKTIRLFALSMMCASMLVACGPSKEAQNVDALITAIGEVSLDSEASIKTAEDALAALQEKDLKDVKNAEALKEARTKYETMVEEAKEAARIQGLKDAAKKVDDKIDAIGKVTGESGNLIKEAKTAYNGLNAEQKTYLEKGDILEAAEKELMNIHVKEAETVIDDIGEVTKDSGEKITAAEDALAKLTAEEKKLVSNVKKIDEAKKAVKELKKAEVETLLAGMKADHDKVQKVSFYHPKGWSFYSNGSWAADKRSFILPYIGKRDQL